MIIKKVNEYNDLNEWYESHNNMIMEIFYKIINGKKIIFNVINSNQYHNALKEFVKYGQFMKIPVKYIFKWKDLILNNISKLEILTSIAGHTSNFPYDDFYDIFDYNHETNEERNGEFSKWCQKKYEETDNNDYIKDYNFGAAYDFLVEVYNIDSVLPLFSNGQFVLSDYAIKPLFELGKLLIEQEMPEEIIVTINKILDVSHQRSDLAEIFIEGGSKTLDYITFESKTYENKIIKFSEYKIN